MTSREALIALNMLPKIGPVRVRRLMDHFGSAQAILQKDARSLMAVQGIGTETAEIIRGWESSIDLAEELKQVRDRALSIVTLEDEAYPDALKQSYDPPLVLYVWGELKEIDRHALAIVGSRKTSHYGIQTARQFAFQLASSGFTIVSGLARGIDTHAHEGAIAAKGRTIAVIGSGLGQVYPPENMALAEKIASGHGAVVSEFSLNTTPSKKTFPMRNRIVAAWSQGVVVVECPEWSGARITANLAGELGRPIFAVPGQIDRPTSAGCNSLIREGATLVTGGQDILDDISVLPLMDSFAIGGGGGDGVAMAIRPELDGTELSIYRALDGETLRIDEILAVTAISLPEVNSTLLKLEIQGLVQQLPGGRFSQKQTGLI
ncbi:MAG: DNA-processing protein DprA [Akkermansiaceae bacterium]|jgi:DNA processing protein|tara:strand:- start:15381 stop:16511 length:1131 start_codon:yes stop_codon:yes gene_type:complete